MVKYLLTIKDKYNTNVLDLVVENGLTVNDQLYIKRDLDQVKFFPIIKSDISEYDSCIGIDNLSKDNFLTTFIINDVLYIIERKPVIPK